MKDPTNALRLRHAQSCADGHRADIEALGGHRDFVVVLGYLRESEASLRVGARQYAKARLAYRLHSFRRRHASAAQTPTFAYAEALGRVLADTRLPWRANRIPAPPSPHTAAAARPPRTTPQPAPAGPSMCSHRGGPARG